MVIALAGFAVFIVIGSLGRGRLGAHIALGFTAVAIMGAYWLSGRV